MDAETWHSLLQPVVNLGANLVMKLCSERQQRTILTVNSAHRAPQSVNRKKKKEKSFFFFSLLKEILSSRR